MYLGKKHRAKIRKRTAIGNSMAHKQWIRVRGVWRNHAVDWKDIVQRQYDAVVVNTTTVAPISPVTVPPLPLFAPGTLCTRLAAPPTMLRSSERS